MIFTAYTLKIVSYTVTSAQTKVTRADRKTKTSLEPKPHYSTIAQSHDTLVLRQRLLVLRSNVTLAAEALGAGDHLEVHHRLLGGAAQRAALQRVPVRNQQVAHLALVVVVVVRVAARVQVVGGDGAQASVARIAVHVGGDERVSTRAVRAETESREEFLPDAVHGDAHLRVVVAVHPWVERAAREDGQRETGRDPLLVQ